MTGQSDNCLKQSDQTFHGISSWSYPVTKEKKNQSTFLKFGWSHIFEILDQVGWI